MIVFGSLVWDGNAGEVLLYKKFDDAVNAATRVDAIADWMAQLAAARQVAEQEEIEEQTNNSFADKSGLACGILEQMGYSWENGEWVPPKIEYTKIMHELQRAGGHANTRTVYDTYKGKKK
jgi:hypothetical protein